MQTLNPTTDKFSYHADAKTINRATLQLHGGLKARNTAYHKD